MRIPMSKLHQQSKQLHIMQPIVYFKLKNPSEQLNPKIMPKLMPLPIDQISQPMHCMFIPLPYMHLVTSKVPFLLKLISIILNELYMYIRMPITFIRVSINLCAMRYFLLDMQQRWMLEVCARVLHRGRVSDDK